MGIRRTMNRRAFFEFLAIGAATALVAPKMLAVESTGLSGTPINKEPFIPKPRYVPHTPEEFGFIEGLTIFEEPREGYDYSIGVETGDGLGGSPSVVSVMRVGKGDESCEQVAEFVSGKHNPAQLVSIVAKIARKYGGKCIDPRGPMIVIEQVMEPGDVIQQQLKIIGFTRFLKVSGNTKDKEGWYSNSWSVPMLMGRFVEAIEHGWYEPKSKVLCAILSKPNKTVYQNPHVRSAAQSYTGYYAFDEDKRND
jgi:hypothetical protein